MEFEFDWLDVESSSVSPLFLLAWLDVEWSTVFPLLLLICLSSFFKSASANSDLSFTYVAVLIFRC